MPNLITLLWAILIEIRQFFEIIISSDLHSGLKPIDTVDGLRWFGVMGKRLISSSELLLVLLM